MIVLALASAVAADLTPSTTRAESAPQRFHATGHIKSFGPNRAFANIADLPVTRYVATQQPLTRVGFIVPNGRFFGYPFRLDNEPLRNAVDAIVEQMKTDGAYARIHQTHFGVPPDAGSIMTRPIPGRGQPDFAGYRAP